MISIHSEFRDVVIELKRIPLNCLFIKGVSPSTTQLRGIKDDDQLRELEVVTTNMPRMTLAEYPTLLIINSYYYLFDVFYALKRIHNSKQHAMQPVKHSVRILTL